MNVTEKTADINESKKTWLEYLAREKIVIVIENLAQWENFKTTIMEDLSETKEISECRQHVVKWNEWIEEQLTDGRMIMFGFSQKKMVHGYFVQRNYMLFKTPIVIWDT